MNLNLAFVQSFRTCLVAVFLMFGFSVSFAAAQPSVKQALSFRPVQDGVDYDIPKESTWGDLQLKDSRELTGNPGFVVVDAGNRLYRRFVDTNDDKKIDTWAYYKNGIEVYRDEDTTKNTVPDTYRWLGSSGTRCGVDEDGDRKIDRWVRISAQESAKEAIESIAAKDQKRFLRLLITAEEIQELDLAPEVSQRIAKRLKTTLKSLKKRLESSELSGEVKWLHFSANPPGLIAAGKKWVGVYDNVSSIVAVGGKNQQVAVGSMIKTGKCWKLIEIPEMVKANVAPSLGGVFFEDAPVTNSSLAVNSAAGVTPKTISVYQETEDAIRKYKGKPGTKALAKLHANRSKALRDIIVATSGKDRQNWAMQFADLVGAGYQSGDFPEGLDEIQKLIKDVGKKKKDQNLVGYLEYRSLGAWYSRAAESSKKLDDLQDQWRTRLEKFVKQYPKVPQAADALFQLANTEDYLGDIETAVTLYRRILAEFPDSSLKPRAKGAVIRLTSEGKKIDLVGKKLTGGDFKLASLDGKMVLIHYWATWCEPCKAEFESMLRLHSKYQKLGFEIVSVSVDEKAQNVLDYLQKDEDLPWIHLYAPGGLEKSPLAAQLGIIALPSMLLVGKDGKVIDQGVTMLQVERELRKLRK